MWRWEYDDGDFTMVITGYGGGMVMKMVVKVVMRVQGEGGGCVIVRVVVVAMWIR